LAADPVEEVKVGFEILKSLELRHRGVNVIACPTCGRVEIDVVKMANELEHRLGHITTPITVSVLGCVVNGIGEGKEADIGIAGGQGVGILFKKGKLYKRVPSEELLDTLIEEVELMAREQDHAGSRNRASDRSDDLPISLQSMEELPLPSRLSPAREIPVLPRQQ
jgi:(E)-4-hydroxy-3-methylbut-2-enyl-diphosphate synthase